MPEITWERVAVRLQKDKAHLQAAGFSACSHKALILSEGEETLRLLKGKKVLLTAPSVALHPEISEYQRTQLQAAGITVLASISEPVAAVQFYLEQNMLGGGRRRIIVVEEQGLYTDIISIRHTLGHFREEKAWKTDIGVHALYQELFRHYADQLLRDGFDLRQKRSACEKLKVETEAAVERMLHSSVNKDEFLFLPPDSRSVYRLKLLRGDFQKWVLKILKTICKELEPERKGSVGEPEGAEAVILLGKLFEYEWAVRQLRELLTEKLLLAYKPCEAAVLGASYFAHRKRLPCLPIHTKSWEMKQAFPAAVCSLAPRLQSAYWRIHYALESHAASVLLPLQSGEELRKVAETLVYDQPDAYERWDYDKSSYICPAGQMKLMLFYKAGCEQLLKQVEIKTEQIIRQSLQGGNCSDAEIIKRVYLYLASHYRYSEKRGKDYPPYAYSMETLLTGDGVCSGFSRSFTRILRRLQIPAMTVTGDAKGNCFDGHAWNLIQIADGSYRHLDVTWDLQCSGHLRFYVLDDIEMRSRNHLWETLRYPACV